jgi:hypothetical protein
MRLDLRLSTIPELRRLSRSDLRRLWRKVYLRELSVARLVAFFIGLVVVNIGAFYLVDDLSRGWSLAVRCAVWLISFWIGFAWVLEPIWPKLVQEASKAPSTGGIAGEMHRSRRDTIAAVGALTVAIAIGIAVGFLFVKSMFPDLVGK